MLENICENQGYFLRYSVKLIHALTGSFRKYMPYLLITRLVGITCIYWEKKINSFTRFYIEHIIGCKNIVIDNHGKG